MNTFLVLYFLGKIIFTLGPYPNGADDVCKSSAIELQENAREHWRDFQEIAKVPIKPIDLIADCVYADQAPMIEGKVIPLN
jgi:hypothetical protein